MNTGTGVAVAAAVLGGAWLLTRKQEEAAGNGLVTPVGAIRDIFINVPAAAPVVNIPAAAPGPDWAAIIGAISNRPAPVLPDNPAIIGPVP